MVCKRPDGTDYAVVMDFGLAKERKAGAELQKLTATGIILGTPEFMSPEQLRGKPLDARTDIYSLALMTYEMLTGKLPFQGRTQQEMMIARLRSDPTPLRKMRPDLDLPESVERVLTKAMQRNPDDRYQTTLEFADAFTAAAAEATARLVSESGLARKTVRPLTMTAGACGRALVAVRGRIARRRRRRVAPARSRSGPIGRRSTSRTTRSRSICRTPARRSTRARR